VTRLKARVGGFHKYVDSADIYKPDPISTHYIAEADRFDKDFSVNDRRQREIELEKKITATDGLRKERL
jgi:hypothetical protein